MKFLVWALVIYLVWRWFVALKKIAATKKNEFDEPDARSPDLSMPTASTAEPEKMVQCMQCGLHLPQSEAVTDGRSSYCSQSHLLLHQSR